MYESIHKYFKIGTIQWMSHPATDRDVLTSIRQIACDDFFDAIEVCKFTSDDERAKAKKMLTEGHMTVCYGAQPRLLGPKLNPNDIDEEGRKKAEATLIEAVDEADWKAEPLHETLNKALIEDAGYKPRLAFGPVRVAVSGRRVSPPLFESMEIIGKPVTVARLKGLREHL